jgi:hypothetical protein
MPQRARSPYYYKELSVRCIGLDVAKAIVKIVDMPFGTRPFRVHLDPAQDGAEMVNGVADRVPAELLRNMQLADLLRPSSTKVPTQNAS